MYLKYLIVFLVSLASSTADYPVAPPELLVEWQRVQIPDVGTIDIPPTMEIQGSTLSKISKELGKQFIQQSEFPESGQVTIQQKGLNALDPEAVKLYVRIMVQTNKGHPGDFETLNSRYDVTQEELREISILFRTQIENQFIRILQWDDPSVEFISGMQSIQLSYRRQIKDNPPVRVATYIFQNYDRMHHLTMSYRESERNRWLSDFPSILESFRITNIIGPSVSTTNPMELVLGEHWILTLIVSAILTWSIGLTPPLLIRFVFVKRPLSKGASICIVVLFLVANIIIFTALGSESKTHGALFLVALASYYVLRSGWRKHHIDVKPQHISKSESSTDNQKARE